eukprot:TRINITY_DN3936_c0_g2_i1.p1 TRINITY_DN3936_c0_g2~~TRINITY_DN3936_c0_g2_i1.p1  ORF type:complete len:413 (+),score=93.68 TRINITY_DN3936_c0_g2_i1:959-2197(+)
MDGYVGSSRNPFEDETDSDEDEPSPVYRVVKPDDESGEFPLSDSDSADATDGFVAFSDSEDPPMTKQEVAKILDSVGAVRNWKSKSGLEAASRFVQASVDMDEEDRIELYGLMMSDWSWIEIVTFCTALAKVDGKISTAGLLGCLGHKPEPQGFDFEASERDLVTIFGRGDEGAEKVGEFINFHGALCQNPAFVEELSALALADWFHAFKFGREALAFARGLFASEPDWPPARLCAVLDAALESDDARLRSVADDAYERLTFLRFLRPLVSEWPDERRTALCETLQSQYRWEAEQVALLEGNARGSARDDLSRPSLLGSRARQSGNASDAYAAPVPRRTKAEKRREKQRIQTALELAERSILDPESVSLIAVYAKWRRKKARRYRTQVDLDAQGGFQGDDADIAEEVSEDAS